MELEDKIKNISELVVGLKFYEWSRIKMAIDKKFAQASSSAELSDAEEIVRAIKLEF